VRDLTGDDRGARNAGMKVSHGFFSFTEVTDPAEHRSYNEWHQLDHLPEQFPLPGIVFGQRWVSTPACRAARAVSDPELDPVHYVTCYLMAEPIGPTLDDFFALGAELHRLDRFHQHRRAHLTGPFAVRGAEAAPRVLVSAAAVPYRAHLGLYVVVEQVGAEDGPDGCASALLEVDGVAGVWTFANAPGLESRRWTEGQRRITVCWLDDDPLAVAVRIAPLVAALPEPARSRVTFAGPFETITPWQWDWFDPS
jgi:hypothetical protein